MYGRRVKPATDSTGGGRARVARALLQIVARDGIVGVSVRNVAAEAGVSGGTVQHYFRTRTQMLHYAMALITEQVAARLAAVPRTGPASEWTRAILLELLPLDEQRHREFGVWLAFSAHADTDPDLGELKRDTADRLRDLYRDLLRARRAAATDSGAAVPSRTAVGSTATGRSSGGEIEEWEAVLLQAVVDGLALQLADLGPREAAKVGPELLDRYLAVAPTGAPSC